MKAFRVFIIVLAIALILVSIPYLISFGARAGIFPIWNYDGTKVVSLTRNLPCKQGVGEAYVRVDSESYPLVIWCPAGIKVTGIKLNISQDGKMAGQITEYSINGKKLPRGGIFVELTSDGKAFATTHSDDEGGFIFEKSTIVPLHKDSAGNVYGDVDVRVAGISCWGFGTYGENGKLSLLDFRGTLGEADFTYSCYKWLPNY